MYCIRRTSEICLVSVTQSTHIETEKSIDFESVVSRDLKNSLSIIQLLQDITINFSKNKSIKIYV